MYKIGGIANFPEWRKAARLALNSNIEPKAIFWQDDNSEPPLEFFSEASPAQKISAFRVPPAFLEKAEQVGCHRSDSRWALLYRLLWRLTHGEGHLLEVPTDPDIATLYRLEKDIRRDIHKMRAFVRFRKVSQAEGDWFVAWFEPGHRIVRLNAPFFVKRFAAMRWSVLTPDECAHWNGQSVTFTPGIQGEKAKVEDGAEELWLTYYRSIFNPARVKVHAMMAEMPRKYWSNLPEAQIIPTLIEGAPERVSKMMESSRAKEIDSDLDETPIPKTNDLNVLKSAAVKCRACPLYKTATQVVFGEGGNEIKMVFVGEQPGDQEDMAGKPFVGPAGAVFDQALAEAGIDREKCYVTNAVKHFKWEPRGKRRIHQKPNAREIGACHPWLAAELGLLKPEMVICLGATAARSVFGREMAVLKNRGKWMESPHCSKTLITVHPSSILRAPDPDEREKAYKDFVADLRYLSQTA